MDKMINMTNIEKSQVGYIETTKTPITWEAYNMTQTYILYLKAVNPLNQSRSSALQRGRECWKK